MNFTQIEQDGKVARKQGCNPMENPYFRHENMPSSTGESFEEWQDKVHHWEIGWYLEDFAKSAAQKIPEKGNG